MVALICSACVHAPALEQGAQRVDSIAAAHAALAYFFRPADTITVDSVAAFARDSGGFVVTVFPVLRPAFVGRIILAGGGGRVRVHPNGKVEVLELFQ